MEKNSYRNIFSEIGKTDEEIERKLNEAVQTFFFDEEERIYHEAGEDMGYLEDTGNHDDGRTARSKRYLRPDLEVVEDVYVYGQGRQRRIFRLVLQDGRDEECLRTCAGRRRILCDVTVFRIPQMGRW